MITKQRIKRKSGIRRVSWEVWADLPDYWSCCAETKNKRQAIQVRAALRRNPSAWPESTPVVFHLVRVVREVVR